MNQLQTQNYSFELNNQLSELKALNRHLIAFGRTCGLPDLSISEINVCLDELFTNIVSYGFNDGLDHKIKFTMTVDDKILTAIIEDDGEPFNPLKKKAVKLPKNVDSAKIGGLGIHITRELVEEVSYERKGRRNRLTLKKSIPANIKKS
jgi:anti-sigma regulatory factor (Ser/Thr protein kinase)